MGRQTTSTDELNQIIRLATTLHAGQSDKSGRPYIGHAERVADMVRNSGGTWVQEQAAWLHDTIEDTQATAQYLLGRGVPGAVVNIVEALTHDKNEPNIEYWQRIVRTPAGASGKALRHLRQSRIRRDSATWTRRPKGD